MATLFDLLDVSHGAANPQSQAAHDSLKPFKATLRSKVLVVIREAGDHGACLEEIAAKLRKQVHSISARVTELKALGLVRCSGRTRPTSTGRDAAVLVVNGIDSVPSPG